MDYQPDPITDELDAQIAFLSGAEPQFSRPMSAFLRRGRRDLLERTRSDSLLQAKSFGLHEPWVWRLDFRTRGLVCAPGDTMPTPCEQHVVALRILPDHLRRADRFELLRLLHPTAPPLFHPNVSDGSRTPPGLICLQIHPGATPLEIALSLHELFRWRLRQYDERDALNPAACEWGRRHVDSPLDDRPLFGRRLQLTWEGDHA